MPDIFDEVESFMFSHGELLPLNMQIQPASLSAFAEDHGLARGRMRKRPLCYGVMSPRLVTP
jgi:hypothetical protein